MKLRDYIENTNSAQDIDVLCSQYAKSLSDIGYDRVIFGLLTDHTRINKAANTLVYSSYPQAWRDYYNENDFRVIDPVRCASVNRSTPFLWEELKYETNLSRKQKQCLNECQDAQLYHGIGIPLHGPFGEMAAVGVASTQKDAEAEYHKDIINIYSYHFYKAYINLLEKKVDKSIQQPNLTDREKEVLTWCAAGKSNWTISQILDITTHGVDFHIRNVMKKLDASSRTVAVVKALHQGLITPI